MLTGGKPHAKKVASLYEPTVLANVTPAMRQCPSRKPSARWRRCSVSRLKKVISLANASEFGLASYFYSRDIGRVWRVPRRSKLGWSASTRGDCQRGGAVRWRQAIRPGREGSKYGIDDFLEIKYICMGGI